jgi:DNA-binding transcriptional ArsR family regulator
MKDKVQEQAAIFAALGDPTRLKLLMLLCQQHESEVLCVNAMVGLLGVSQPAISQHLRVLKSVGLVRGERHGSRVHYAVVPDALKRYQVLLSETLTQNNQEIKDLCRNCPIQK